MDHRSKLSSSVVLLPRDPSGGWEEVVLAAPGRCGREGVLLSPSNTSDADREETSLALSSSPAPSAPSTLLGGVV